MLNRQESRKSYTAARIRGDRQLCIRVFQAMTRPLKKASLYHACLEEYSRSRVHCMSQKKFDGRYTEVYHNIPNMNLVGIDHRFEMLEW